MITAEELHKQLSSVSIGASTCNFSLEKCQDLAPKINQINTLKKEKNAIILAHSYVSPEILTGVADFVGDSFELSKKAAAADCDIIIFAAVKFMAETAKILSPNKKVLVPSEVNGCSLADSITAEDVMKLKKEYPDYAFICYINTTAEVKALCDVCVTSSNVYKIVSDYPSDKIFFLPDQLMGMNIQNYLTENDIDKTFKYSKGKCYVHDEYDPDMIEYLSLKHPNAAIAAHPECKPSITALANFVGSTSQMMNFVANSNHDEYVLLTECGLSSRLQMEHPQKKFIGSCTMCKYMKSNRIEQIIDLLENETPQLEITLSKEIIEKAKQSLDEMFKYS